MKGVTKADDVEEPCRRIVTLLLQGLVYNIRQVLQGCRKREVFLCVGLCRVLGDAPERVRVVRDGVTE